MADPMTPERLAEIREHLARTRDLNVCVDDWHLTLARDADNLLDEVEQLRAELAETRHALEVTGEKADTLRGQRDRAEAERNTALAELNGAYRGAEELRSMLRDRTAERDQARAELAKRPKSRLGEQVNRLSNAVGDLERERDDALGERDQAREQVKALADEWEATITSGVMSGQEWEQCLRANLPRLRAALDGTEPGQ